MLQRKMSKLFGLKLKLQIDYCGKLRVNANGSIRDLYVVEGFKIKAVKEKNYLYPILKIEISGK